ncbi:ubiquitin-like protein FUBI [Sinocyclocheilus rhinocerous]|uniref:ubiquitin-like protein FUBI n=1 Tax=Sinocyclocheilus rhinocerous TaxID=307959 RepID=UPI0007B8F6C5|nr:PREDICTED: ubiquitin-like protein FUBI [Sinocyclocheilus rhinocerous]
MQLFLRAQTLHTLHVSAHESVRELKARVQALEGLSVEEQVLLLAGAPLEDDAELLSCGVTEHCTLQLTARLLGGMRKNYTFQARELVLEIIREKDQGDFRSGRSDFGSRLGSSIDSALEN